LSEIAEEAGKALSQSKWFKPEETEWLQPEETEEMKRQEMEKFRLESVGRKTRSRTKKLLTRTEESVQKGRENRSKKIASKRNQMVVA